VKLLRGTALTRAEKRSVELKWFRVTPGSEGRILFAVKLARVYRTPRFSQQITVEMRQLPLGSAEERLTEVYTITTGLKPVASVSFARGCRRLRVRLNRTARTVTLSMPTRCVGAGPARVRVSTLTLWRDPATGHLLGGSRDLMRFRATLR